MYISAIATRQLEIGIGTKAFSFSFGGVNMDLPTITGRPERGITDSLPLVAGADPTLVRAAFGLALHMHQPTVLGDGDRVTAPLISNLQHMLEHQEHGDNHNARCSCAATGASPISSARWSRAAADPG